MIGKLDGKVAVVVGGGRGLGEATALCLAAQGARVVVCDVLLDEAAAVSARIRAAGGIADAIYADITNSGSFAEMIAQTVQLHGRLDVAANIAGVVGPKTASTELDQNDFEQVLSVNVTGTFLAMKHEIAAMLESGGGAIVNTSSVNGVIGLAGLLAYTASKHAVIGMTKAAALEFADRNIRINAIAPGPIATSAALANARRSGHQDQLTAAIPLGRYGDPREIGDAITFLLSDEASFMTGSTMVVDGGYTAA